MTRGVCDLACGRSGRTEGFGPKQGRVGAADLFHAGSGRQGRVKAAGMHAGQGQIGPGEVDMTEPCMRKIGHLQAAALQACAAQICPCELCPVKDKMLQPCTGKEAALKVDAVAQAGCKRCCTQAGSGKGGLIKDAVGKQAFLHGQGEAGELGQPALSGHKPLQGALPEDEKPAMALDKLDSSHVAAEKQAGGAVP